MSADDERRTAAVHGAVDYDDRKVLADLWQDHAPLPSEGLTPNVYGALLAVARWGAGRMYDDRTDEEQP